MRMLQDPSRTRQKTWAPQAYSINPDRGKSPRSAAAPARKKPNLPALFVSTEYRAATAMPSSILVTGGAGYIGAHAAKALARAGYLPVVYDNLSRGRRAAVRWGPLVEGDIADRERLAAVFAEHKISAVMHFAAFAYVGESVADPALYYRNNLAGSLALFDAMRISGVREIVFSSTCATYGTPQEVPIREIAPQTPVNPYGETKLAVERALRWYGDAYGVRWAALRYFNAAGGDREGEIGEDHDPETHLVPLVVQAALGRRPAIEVFGTDYATPDGTAIRDYIHVEDLATAHVQALDRLRAGGSSIALNLGTGRGYSVRDVIAAAERVCDRAVPARDAPRRFGDPPILVADPGLAAQTLGWRAACSDLETIIRTAFAWESQKSA
jgi:UDP-arabinose 4-epimerase